MSYTCHDLCYRVETLNKKSKKYGNGIEKFCSVCCKFILSYTNRCICCNNQLRNRTH